MNGIVSAGWSVVNGVVETARPPIESKLKQNISTCMYTYHLDWSTCTHQQQKHIISVPVVPLEALISLFIRPRFLFMIYICFSFKIVSAVVSAVKAVEDKTISLVSNVVDPVVSRLAKPVAEVVIPVIVEPVQKTGIIYIYIFLCIYISMHMNLRKELDDDDERRCTILASLSFRQYYEKS